MRQIKKQILESKKYGMYDESLMDLMRKGYITSIDFAILCFILNVKNNPTQSNIRSYFTTMNLSTIKKSLNRLYSLNLLQFKKESKFAVFFDANDLECFHQLLEKNLDEAKEMCNDSKKLDNIISVKRQIKIII